MQETIDRIRRLPGVGITETPESWSIRIARPAGRTTEISVPRSVLEWWATVADGESELWKDWIDYSGYEKHEDSEELGKEMARDVEAFVHVALQAEDFRLSSQPVLLGIKRSIAQWLVNGEWRAISLARQAPITSDD